MKDLIFIKHQNLTPDSLERICILKSSAWNYSIDEQKQWIDLNIKPNDTHVLLVEKGEYLAYLNLIQTTITTKENNTIEVLGIGNVCAKVKKMGYGSSLMKGLNNYLIENKNIAILLCKKELVFFYESFGYILNYELKDNVFLLSLNLDETTFTLNGKLF